MPRTSTLDLLKKADSNKLVMVTAYDYTMARLAEQGSVDVVLVGDSLGMVMQGLFPTSKYPLYPKNTLASSCMQFGGAQWTGGRGLEPVPKGWRGA